MILAYVGGLGPQRDEIDLCLVADKLDSVAVPVRVKDLFPTSAAVVRIGLEEAVIVKRDETDQSLIIAALPPGGIFLTPNLMQSPGMKVRRIKVTGDSPEEYRTYYDRERSGWEEWVANKERE